MSGLSSIVKNKNDQEEDLFAGIDVELPKDAIEAIKPSLNSVVSSDEGDTPPANAVEGFELSPPPPMFANADERVSSNKPLAKTGGESLEQYASRAIEFGADKDVVNVVLTHCANGLSDQHGKEIIKNAVKHGLGVDETTQLCQMSMRDGIHHNKIESIAAQMAQANDSSNNSAGRVSVQREKSIKNPSNASNGIKWLWTKLVNNPEKISKSFDKALASADEAAMNVCRSSLAHNIAAIKSALPSDHETAKKLAENIKTDYQSAYAIQCYQESMDRLKKEAKLLLGKAKTPEQAGKIKSQIDDGFSDLNDRYKGKMDFINDDARNPIAEFIAELGKELDKMFAQVMDRFGVRAANKNEASANAEAGEESAQADAEQQQSSSPSQSM